MANMFELKKGKPFAAHSQQGLFSRIRIGKEKRERLKLPKPKVKKR